MITFNVGKPSDLIEKILYLQEFDPNNPTLPTLLERETDLFRPLIVGTIDSEKFKEVVEKLAKLKTQLAANHHHLRESRHALYNLAASNRTTPDEYRQGIIEFRNADQAILATKDEIDALVS